MNMIVLVLMMAVTVEALIEYAKTFGRAIIEKQWKTAATQAGAVALGVSLCFSARGGFLRCAGRELQRGVAGRCAYRRLCQPRRELCERPCEEAAGAGRGAGGAMKRKSPPGESPGGRGRRRENGICKGRWSQ